MTTKTNKGLVLGKFAPMHKGHLYMIAEASMRCHELTVILCVDHLHDPEFPTIEQRKLILEKELNALGNVKLVEVDCTSFPYAKEDDETVSKYWAEFLHKTFPDTTTLFGSEEYVAMMAKHWPDCLGVRHDIIDVDRKAFPISATMVREDPYSVFPFVVDSAKHLYTANVLVMGAESCGKSTLTKQLSKILKAPLVPEMYRSMFPEKGMDFTAQDLVEVGVTQTIAQRTQIASPLNKGLVVHDTCTDITLMYAKEYYPEATDIHEYLESLQITGSHANKEVKFNLILFCDIDVNWDNDGTRTLGNKDDRQRMRDVAYSLAIQKAKRHNCKVVIVPADYARLPAALDAIGKIIKTA